MALQPGAASRVPDPGEPDRRPILTAPAAACSEDPDRPIFDHQRHHYFVGDDKWAITYSAHFTEFLHPPDEGAGGRHQGRHSSRSTPRVVEIRLFGTYPQRLLLHAMPADHTGFIRRVCVAEVR